MIIFVAGYPCSGKSTFINENFKDAKVIDVYDFQKDKKCLSYYDVIKSYEQAADELLNACHNNKTVVFEHTLLKSIRRKEYVYFLRRNGVKDDIKLYFLIPDEEKHKNFLIKRNIKNPEDVIKSHKETVELPNETEGFSEIIIIE